MDLDSTRIVVPDFLNGRIVQMDDMSGGGWKSTDLGLGSEFMPRDVEFDSLGRIYIANRPNAGDAGIIRIDDIDDATPEVLVHNSGVYTLAIDTERGFLYYIDDSEDLYRTDLDGDSPQLYEGFNSPFGMDVDEDGILYIGHSPEGGEVWSYDPSGSGSLLYSYYVNDPRDVIVKEGYVYVAQNHSAAEDRIVQLTKDLQTTVATYYGPSGNEFYGPYRFVARVGAAFCVIDDFEDMNRLTRFDDMSGSGWQTYAGKPGDEFSFYETGGMGEM
jgi:hypothetical protein